MYTRYNMVQQKGMGKQSIKTSTRQSNKALNQQIKQTEQEVDSTHTNQCISIQTSNNDSRQHNPPNTQIQQTSMIDLDTRVGRAG